MSNVYILHRRMPTLDEYESICNAVGWTEYMNFDVVEQSLKHSLFGVVVHDNDNIVGMGRVIGDGSIYFYIQDVAVVPEHQNNGVGSLIMEAITTYLKEKAPEKSFIGLFSAQGKEDFYRKYGLNKHEGMTVMFGVVHEREIK